MSRIRSLSFTLSLVLPLISTLFLNQIHAAEPKANIEWQVVKEAEVTQFDFEKGTYEKDPAVVFTVGLKNASDKPQRFRLNVFLTETNKGVGSLVPDKGSPPLLEAGQTATVTLPVPKTSELPKDILVVVTPAGY
jgi:hypothetical protein